MQFLKCRWRKKNGEWVPIILFRDSSLNQMEIFDRDIHWEIGSKICTGYLSNSEFLPWEYQIQAIDANIIYIEENLLSNQKKYDYYNTLMSLSENLLEKIRNSSSSLNTTQEFSVFVASTIDDYTKIELGDYVTAYIQKIENIVFNNTPLVEEPAISLIPRGIVRKSIVICAVLLMVTTLIAFLKEAAQKNKHIVT